jgi:hypothetical protein
MAPASKPPVNNMNKGESSSNFVSTANSRLLDTIRAIRVSVGDELSDDEFTRLLQQMELPVESGFVFLSYCDRFVMLSVPRQELANWYQENGRIVPAREQIVRRIGEKYGLSLCQPPDMLNPWPGFPNPHHHLQLSNQQEAIIIVHPQYVKIRAFVRASPTHSAHVAQKPLHTDPDLLQDLSALYQERSA